MEVLLSAALLPALILMYYVYKKDMVEKEPPRLVARLFAFGAIAGPVAGIIESILFGVAESIFEPSIPLIVLENFICVALVEECCKFGALSTVRNNPEFNYVFDGVVYSVAVALGFAALENVLYVFEGGIEVAITRAIFAVPGHCADGVVMGCFFGLAKKASVQQNSSSATPLYVLAVLLPTIEHGFYDAALSTEIEVLGFLALAFQLVFIIVAGVLVNVMSKQDTPIGSAHPARLNQIGQPAQPMQPMQPAQPMQPMQPGQPTQSGQAPEPPYRQAPPSDHQQSDYWHSS